MGRGTRNNRTRYRSGFFARYLRGFVIAKMDAEGWRQQQVAKWLGIPDYALSEYLNRHTHPAVDRREQLLRLGCAEQGLLRAELLDKLEWWMDNHDMSPDEARNFLHEIQAYRYRVRQSRGEHISVRPEEVAD